MAYVYTVLYTYVHIQGPTIDCFKPCLCAGLDVLLTPGQIHLKPKSTIFVDLWAGSYNTVAQTEKVSHWGKIYV
jgi:hypothetical protein